MWGTLAIAMFMSIALVTGSAYLAPPPRPMHSVAPHARARTSSMLIPFIDSGKPGLNVRPYDKLLNFAAPTVVPILVQTGSKIFKPLYSVMDRIRNRKAPSDFRATCSNSYQPIVIFSSRTVTNVPAYKEAFSEFATEAQASGAGVRAMFSFMDREKENTALQLTWYDGPTDFVAASSKLAACYAGTEATDYTQVWGGWDDAMKAAIRAEGCKSSFVKDVRDFLKDPSIHMHIYMCTCTHAHLHVCMDMYIHRCAASSRTQASLTPRALRRESRR